MKNNKNIKDLTGQRFGRLTVIGIHPTETRKTYWSCQCDCGNMKIVRSDSLQCGAIRSCGCLKKEQDKKNLVLGDGRRKFSETGFKVGGTRLYNIWQNMKGRCYNEHDTRYDRYGGRGIKVCEEWRDNFVAFYDWAMSHGYQNDLTIDRIDNNGDYCPDNCRWTTNKEQCNNRSTNIKIKIGNATKTLTEWCEIFQVDYKTVRSRLQRNNDATIEELFNR